MKFDTAALMALLSILLTLLAILVACVRGFTEVKELLGFTVKRVDWQQSRLDDHEGRIGTLEVGHGEMRTRLGMHQEHV